MITLPGKPMGNIIVTPPIVVNPGLLRQIETNTLKEHMQH